MAVRVRFPFRALLMKIKRNEKPTQRKDIKFLRLSVFFAVKQMLFFTPLLHPNSTYLIFPHVRNYFPTSGKNFSHVWENASSPEKYYKFP